MAGQPPHTPWEPGNGDGGPHDERRRAASSSWRRCCTRAWRGLRALPSWQQLLLWLAGWPVVAALYFGSNRRLGPLAAPLTLVTLLLGGPTWWSILTEDAVQVETHATDTAQRPDVPAASAFGTVAFAGEATGSHLPEFDPGTLEIDIVECVQTRSASSVRDSTIRQPRIVVRVTNHGPERTVLLTGAVLLDGYDWNGGWKPTAGTDLTVRRDETGEATLLTDYRHQASYSPDGLHACRLIDVEVVAPQVWPDHPARQTLPVESETVVGSERDFDPQRDLLRWDTR